MIEIIFIVGLLKIDEMKVRHLQEQDKQYRVFLYIFYAASAMMVSILIYGVVMMTGEWQENGTLCNG